MAYDEDCPVGESKVSFCLNDKILDEIRRFSFEKDKSASEVLRASIMVGFASVKKMPALIRMVSEDIWVGDEKDG